MPAIDILFFCEIHEQVFSAWQQHNTLTTHSVSIVRNLKKYEHFIIQQKIYQLTLESHEAFVANENVQKLWLTTADDGLFSHGTKSDERPTCKITIKLKESEKTTRIKEKIKIPKLSLITSH